MRYVDFENVKADVLLAGTHLGKARDLLSHGNPAIPGLLVGPARSRCKAALVAINEALRDNGELLNMLRDREKIYRQKADALDV